MLKTIKIIFYLSAILFIAKPFFGFSLLNRNAHEEETNCILLVKLFSKRKNDAIDENIQEYNAIQQRILRLSLESILTFLGFLSLFIFSFLSQIKLTASFIKQINFSLPGREHTYLHVRSFLI